MTNGHKWHVEDSLVGCLPDGLATFATKREATAFLKRQVDELRANGERLRGSLKCGHFTDGSAWRLFIERCDDPDCQWDEEISS